MEHLANPGGDGITRTHTRFAGRIVNPGNDGFAGILSDRYVDKTGLIREFDSTLGTPRKLVLSTRPRRFGKSYTVDMLAAFYSCGCDSRGLFEGLEVAGHEGWDEHLNKYNVVCLDMVEVIDAAKVSAASRILRDSNDLVAWTSLIVPKVTEWIMEGLREVVPDAGYSTPEGGNVLTYAILDVVRATGRKFVFVIDEWDAPWRLAEDDAVAQEAYADLLRALFKGRTFTPVAVAGAYMTGILPLKKHPHQSALSDFREFTMLRPGVLAPYIGFTEDEVAGLCDEAELDPSEVRRFYDGYTLRYVGRGPDGRRRGIVVETYCPYSVMQAYQNGKVKSYWPSSSTHEALVSYIELDICGLQARLAAALGGADVPVDIITYQNDMVTLRSADDVLTLLAHLGYLAYDRRSGGTGTVRVPNEEVRRELSAAFSGSCHPLMRQMMTDSIALLDDVAARRAERIAEGIAVVHDRDCAPRHYNDEQALRAVVKSALVAGVDEYVRIEEMSGGHGIADIVYIPKPSSAIPALVVELKWDKPVESAIAQIKDRGYCKPLEGIGVPVLLIGVTYDADTKEHTCVIEEWVR
jgi:hypothetical protein